MTNPFSLSDPKESINDDVLSPVYDFMMAGTGVIDHGTSAEHRPQPSLKQDGYMFKHDQQETIEDEDTSRDNFVEKSMIEISEENIEITYRPHNTDM